MNNKFKNMAVVLGGIILVMLTYKLGIAKTIAVIKENKKLHEELVLVENIPKKLTSLKQQNAYYNKLLNDYQLSGSSVQNSLLKTINKFSDSLNIKVIDFSEPHILDQEEYVKKTYMFTLSGGFKDLQSLIYHLEQHAKYGEIINLHFEQKKDYRSRKNFLEATVLLRSIE